MKIEIAQGFSGAILDAFCEKGFGVCLQRSESTFGQGGFVGEQEIANELMGDHIEGGSIDGANIPLTGGEGFTRTVGGEGD